MEVDYQIKDIFNWKKKNRKYGKRGIAKETDFPL
jgi:hypothetical protein